MSANLPMQNLNPATVEPTKVFEPQLIAINIKDVKMRPTRWLWKNRVALGRITLFAGLPGEAKSIATIDLAATITTGRAVFGDGAPNILPPSGIAYLAMEDSREETQTPRFVCAGGKQEDGRLTFLEGKRVKSFDTKGNATIVEQLLSLDADLPLIEKHFLEHPDDRALVIDPISSYLGKVSMNETQEVRRVLTALQQLAERFNIAVIVILHLNKKADLVALQRVTGAGAFIEMARSSWLFCTDPDDSELRLMVPLKNNCVPRKTGGLEFRIEAVPLEIEGKTEFFPVISWGKRTERQADEVVISREGVEQAGDGGKLLAACRWLMDRLSTGRVASEKLFEDAQEAGHKERTVRRALERIEAVTEQDQGQWWWSLPPMPTVEPRAGSVGQAGGSGQLAKLDK